MSDPTQPPTTVTNIGVAMFTVADQNAALAFYTEKMGFEVRVRRRVRRARRGTAGWRSRRPARPPGWHSTRRWTDEPGGGAIGIETADVARRARPVERPSAGSRSTQSRCRRPARRPVHDARPRRQPHRRRRDVRRLSGERPTPWPGRDAARQATGRVRGNGLAAAFEAAVERGGDAQRVRLGELGALTGEELVHGPCSTGRASARSGRRAAGTWRRSDDVRARRTSPVRPGPRAGPSPRTTRSTGTCASRSRWAMSVNR